MKSIRDGLRWLALGGLFLRELAMSVKDVLLTIINPSRVSRSGFAAIALDEHEPWRVALLANLVTLTPGTTSLHVSADRKTLYVHVMNLSEDSVPNIRDGFGAYIARIGR